MSDLLIVSDYDSAARYYEKVPDEPLFECIECGDDFEYSDDPAGLRCNDCYRIWMAENKGEEE